MKIIIIILLFVIINTFLLCICIDKNCKNKENWTSADGPCNDNWGGNCNNCGHPNADSDEVVCCDPNGNDPTVYGTFCANLPNGTSCWTDAMCACGNCKGNDEFLGVAYRRGICNPE